MMYSVTIMSDDQSISGNVQYIDTVIGGSYIARIYDQRIFNVGWGRKTIITFKIFNDGVSAENWMLDKLECPLFTILAK